MNSKNVGPVAWLVFALCSLGMFIKVTAELYEDSELRILDDRILILISKIRRPWITGSMVDITALGSATLISLFCLGTVLFLWHKRDRVASLYVAMGSLGAVLWTLALKSFFRRPRPTVVPRLVEVSSYSYPSGHSLVSTSFYLLLMFLFWRVCITWKQRLSVGAIALAVAAMIAFSRLYLGVHFPSDVLSGACLGAAWVFFLTAVFSKYLAIELSFTRRS